MKDFELGTPALVCRWRLANRHLPLQNRHLRALLARRVNGDALPRELVTWAKQQIEWTLDQGAAEYPHGVLMFLMDDGGHAAMTVGPYVAPDETRLAEITRRAERADAEGRLTGVAPETLWLARGDVLIWDQGAYRSPSGASSLVLQLAQTLGLVVNAWDGLLDAVATGAVDYDEAFLVSDEHGVICASDAAGRHGRRMAQGYLRLLERTHS